MDHYCVMGNPVEHSKSPWIHARFARLTGQDMAYTRRLIPLDGFAEAVRAFRAEGGHGCNITVPFKFEAPALATRRGERVLLAGAANCLKFEGDEVLADNTDGIGLLRDIRDNAEVDPAGRELLLVGAGGAGAGVLGPLLEAGPRRVQVANRSAAKASVLVERHRAVAERHGVQLSACGLDSIQGSFDLIVNATAASLAGDGIPVPPAAVRAGALAVDLMYGPAAAPFLDWAQAHGAVGRDGLGMLVEQAAEAFLFWRGVRPPSQQVLAELRAELQTERAAAPR